MTRTLLALSFSAILFILLTANSGGAALTQGEGFTGAPSAGGGTEGVCGNCHRGGGFDDPVVSLLLDGTDTLTAYVPGQTYEVTLAVSPSMGAPAGYGFQAQVLDAANTAAGKFSNPGTDARITELSNGREYAEQSRVSSNGSFTFEWTAPPAGTGSVIFYSVGNAVNGNGSTAGDNGSSSATRFRFQESTTTSVRDLATIDLGIFPNPTSGPATLTTDIRQAGEYMLSTYDLRGKRVSEQHLNLSVGSQRLPLAVEGLPRGMYVVRLIGAGYHGSGKVLVR